MTVKVGINGFGRIGRQVLKAIKEKYADEFDVVARAEFAHLLDRAIPGLAVDELQRVLIVRVDGTEPDHDSQGHLGSGCGLHAAFSTSFSRTA